MGVVSKNWFDRFDIMISLLHVQTVTPLYVYTVHLVYTLVTCANCASMCILLLHVQTVTPHADRCSNPLPWDPLSSP